MEQELLQLKTTVEEIRHRLRTHVHNGVDTQPLKYNDILDTRNSPKFSTIVIGPSSNTDSADYDYVTDGTADDVQIQAAIDSLPTNGGSILLREGSYVISTTITISKNGVTIMGVGTGTRITCASNFNSSFFKLGHASTNYYDCTIESIYFDGNKANVSGSSNVLIDNHTFTVPINRTKIRNCVFYNFEDYGVKVKTSYTEIYNNFFLDWQASSADYAIYGEANGKILVYNNIFSGDGAIIYTCGSIENNIFVLANGYAYTMIENCSNVAGNLVIGGTAPGANCRIFKSCTKVFGNHVDFDSGGNVSSICCEECSYIEHNYFSKTGKAVYSSNSSIAVIGNGLSSTGHVIHISSGGSSTTGSGSRIVGNLIDGGSDTDNTYSGIFLDGDTFSTTITSNNIINGNASNKLKYGINEDSAGGADKNIIVANCVYGKTTAINTGGASTVVANNITY